MVRLQDISTINAQKFPILSDWDKKVRKNYELYQNLIDARTYQLQRVQRYILSLKYPRGYNSDLITLNLLKKKQRVGQVTSHEISLYKSINPCIESQYKRTFGSFEIPKFGLAIGGSLFLYSSFFNFSVPTRLLYFVLPICVDYFWTRRSPKTEISSSEFLDWVFEYRKAKVFNQRNRHLFNNPQVQKIIGKSSLAAIGDNLVKQLQ